MSKTLCKEGLDFLRETFSDFPETEEEQTITLDAIIIGVKHADADNKKLSSSAKNILNQLNGKQISLMQKELNMDNLIEKELFMTETGDMTPVAQLSMGLSNEFEPAGKETNGQPRVKTIAENYEHNLSTNYVVIDGLNQYAEIKNSQAQTLAHAYYGAYVDTYFDTRSDNKKISEIINKQPLDVIALSLIAEKNRENQIPSRIQDTNDLEEKLKLPQIKKLSQTLTFVALEDSIDLTKEHATPFPDLSRTPDGGNSSGRITTGRE